MTKEELKTLKDLEIDQFNQDDKDYRKHTYEKIVYSKMLKAEAIKWVKSLDNYDNENMETKEWIKFFFNLTEEDLQ